MGNLVTSVKGLLRIGSAHYSVLRPLGWSALIWRFCVQIVVSISRRQVGSKFTVAVNGGSALGRDIRIEGIDLRC